METVEQAHESVDKPNPPTETTRRTTVHADEITRATPAEIGHSADLHFYATDGTAHLIFGTCELLHPKEKAASGLR